MNVFDVSTKSPKAAFQYLSIFFDQLEKERKQQRKLWRQRVIEKMKVWKYF